MTLHDVNPNSRAEIETALARALAAEPEVQAAWVFGSFARGEAFEDIDVGVLLTTKLAWNWVIRLGGRLEAALDRTRVEIDVRDLGDAPVHFQREVVSTGRLLLCRDRDLVARFEAAVDSGYEATRDARRAVVADAMHRLEALRAGT
jgi:predicted nucleotidyltransferase